MFSKLNFIYHLLKFSRDPQNTTGVFRFTDALIAGATKAERDALNLMLLEDPRAASLYGSQNKDYLYRSFDLTELRRCRPGTLGHQYATMMDSAGLDPEFFEYLKITDPVSYFVTRMRKTHDLYHVLSGFDTSIPGEIGLQGFYIAQLHTGVPLSIAVSALLHVIGQRDPDAIKLAMHALCAGYQAGLKANLLHGVPWEELWHSDLQQVRIKFGLKGYAPLVLVAPAEEAAAAHVRVNAA